jgi:hypothetical protein
MQVSTGASAPTPRCCSRWRCTKGSCPFRYPEKILLINELMGETFPARMRFPPHVTQRGVQAPLCRRRGRGVSPWVIRRRTDFLAKRRSAYGGFRFRSRCLLHPPLLSSRRGSPITRSARHMPRHGNDARRSLSLGSDDRSAGGGRDEACAKAHYSACTAFAGQ